MKDIKCPYDLNQFLLGEPIFENTFPKEECEQRKFYGDCYHCFATAIAKRDRGLKDKLKDNIIEKINSKKIYKGRVSYSDMHDADMDKIYDIALDKAIEIILICEDKG